MYIILDTLKVHHSKIVKKWKEENKDKIVLFFLLSYSPKVNPNEYLNNDLKTGLGLKSNPKNDNQWKNNVQSHMMELQKNPEQVAHFFHHKSIKYVAT